MDAHTGSTTRGTPGARCDHACAMASMIGAEANIPVLAAWMPISVMTASICAATTCGGIS
ncbi:Uncharacterised protein [Mycobacteroides abscessus subsp. massiliense]|nr:Uncharacterised protein [Mycobacteroides abscessus subsp. massiliense]